MLHFASQAPILYNFVQLLYKNMASTKNCWRSRTLLQQSSITIKFVYVVFIVSPTVHFTPPLNNYQGSAGPLPVIQLTIFNTSPSLYSLYLVLPTNFSGVMSSSPYIPIYPCKQILLCHTSNCTPKHHNL